MSDIPEQIISENEIIRVHAYANFGSMSPREVVNDGVRKYAIGFSGGSTQLAILREHGLVTKQKGISYHASLTKKGKEYARAIYTRTDTIAAALVEAERRGMMRAAEIADADAEKLADEAALWAIDKMANAERIALAQHNAGNRISAAIRQAAGELK